MRALHGKLVSLQQVRERLSLQTIYINLDHVITAERVREYTLVKFSDGSETKPPELVVCAI